MKNKIVDIMTTDLISVKSTDDLLESYNKMKANKIRHLPVMDHHRNVIGVISHQDLLQVFPGNLYPVKDKVLESLQNWLSKTPIGEVARSLSLNGI